MKRLFAVLAIFLFATNGLYAADKTQAGNPKVRMTTNMGVIELELQADKAPLTVENFLAYTARGYYNGVIFHRVIPGFMIQGGGFVPGMREKSCTATWSCARNRFDYNDRRFPLAQKSRSQFR